MSENKYVCKYGLYHHKPVIDEEPSSNNGWIYTAYAVYSGLDYSLFELRNVFRQCLKNTDIYLINRLPNKSYPPISRDELIGMTYLDAYTFNVINNNNYKLHDINLVNPSFVRIVKDSAKALMHYIVNQDRNYFWKARLFGVYPIAMSISYADRYSIKKHISKKTNIVEFIAFYLYAFKTLIHSKNYEKSVLFIQLIMINSKLVRYLSFKELMKNEFPKDHPILQSK